MNSMRGQVAEEEAVLRSRLELEKVKIRERELNLFSANLNAISFTSALIAGFAYQGINQITVPDDTSPVLQSFYFGVIGLALGLSLISCLVALFCVVYGPTLAMMGAEGGMSFALEGMKEKQRLSLRFFYPSCVFFCVSAVLWGWIAFPTEAAWTMSLLFGICIPVMIWQALKIPLMFKVPDEALAVTRRPENFQIRSASAQVEDDRVIAKGWLSKRSGNMKVIWQDRFVLLTIDGDLVYFKSVSDIPLNKHRGKLSCGDVCSVTVSEPSLLSPKSYAGKRLDIVMNGNLRTYSFVASSHESACQWRQHILEAKELAEKTVEKKIEREQSAKDKVTERQKSFSSRFGGITLGQADSPSNSQLSLRNGEDTGESPGSVGPQQTWGKKIKERMKSFRPASTISALGETSEDGDDADKGASSPAVRMESESCSSYGSCSGGSSGNGSSGSCSSCGNGGSAGVVTITASSPLSSPNNNSYPAFSSLTTTTTTTSNKIATPDMSSVKPDLTASPSIGSMTLPNATVVSGWVSKKSGTNFLWQDRLLVLTANHQLQYFKSSEDKALDAPAGVVLLSEASRVDASHKDNNCRFLVHMADGSRTYAFSASTAEVAKQWVNYIGGAIVAAKHND